jgi:hypothetical protein
MNPQEASVRPLFYNDIERITVAFNMYELKEWEDKQKIQWVNK